MEDREVFFFWFGFMLFLVRDLARIISCPCLFIEHQIHLETLIDLTVLRRTRGHYPDEFISRSKIVD